MSDAWAQVFTPQGELVGYTVYHGSSSGIWPPTLTREFTWDHRHDFGRVGVCDCEWSEAEPCIITHNYGGGSWWAGLCCLKHRELLGPFSEYAPEVGYGPYEPGPDYFDGHPWPELARTDLVATPPTTGESE